MPVQESLHDLGRVKACKCILLPLKCCSLSLSACCHNNVIIISFTSGLENLFKLNCPLVTNKVIYPSIYLRGQRWPLFGLP